MHMPQRPQTQDLQQYSPLKHAFPVQSTCSYSEAGFPGATIIGSKLIHYNLQLAMICLVKQYFSSAPTFLFLLPHLLAINHYLINYYTYTVILI